MFNINFSYLFLVGSFLLTGCSGIGLYDDVPLVSSNNISHNDNVVLKKTPEVSYKETPETRYASLMKTWEGYVLLVGWDGAKDCDYDTSTLSKEDKELCIIIGLSIIESNAELDEYKKLNPTILSNYYNYKKEFKKAMYWAFKGAENGSPDCMLLLSNAYRSGNGLVQDVAEGVKWTYLGAAAGDAWCKQWIKDNGISGLMNEYMAPIILEGQKRANQWMREHSEVFISAE